MNILSLTNGSLRNFISTVSTNSMTFVETTSTAVVAKISSLMFSNNTTSLLETATAQIVADGVTRPLAIGMDVDPEQPPEPVVDKSRTIYLTGDQKIVGSASSTNVSVIVTYEEFS